MSLVISIVALPPSVLSILFYFNISFDDEYISSSASNLFIVITNYIYINTNTNP